MKPCQFVLVALLWIFGAARPALAEFTVGVVLPLSGDMQEYGTAALRGMELAREEFSAPLRNVKFVYEDGKYDPATSAAAAHLVIARNQPDVLFVWGDYPAEAVVPIAQERRIPTFVGTLNADSTKHRPFVFRFINSAADYVAPLVNHFKEHELRRIAVLYVQDPYYLHLITALRKQLPNESIVAIEELPSEQSDFRSVIARLRKSEPDAVAVYLMPGAGAAFLRQAVSLQFQPLFFGGDIFESRTEIETAEGAMEGVLYAHNFALPAFQKRYQEKFGDDCQVTYAANGHAFVELVASVLGGKDATIPPDKIMELFRAVKRSDSAAGSFEYYESTDGDASFRFPVALKRVEGGVPVIVPVTKKY